MKWLPFNVNDRMRVTLTQLGADILNKRNAPQALGAKIETLEGAKEAARAALAKAGVE